MRGRKNRQGAMFYAFNIEQRVRADHPLRAIKKLALAKPATLLSQESVTWLRGVERARRSGVRGGRNPQWRRAGVRSENQARAFR